MDDGDEFSEDNEVAKGKGEWWDDGKEVMTMKWGV